MSNVTIIDYQTFTSTCNCHFLSLYLSKVKFNMFILDVIGYIIMAVIALAILALLVYVAFLGIIIISGLAIGIFNALWIWIKRFWNKMFRFA